MKKLNKVLALPNRAFRSVLRLIFRFDKWHVNTMIERKYVSDIITYINKRYNGPKQTVVEIGCGLGDLLRRLNVKEKVGFDIESNVLKAARVLSTLSGENIRFQTFSFPESDLTLKVNIILMVNWIHHISPEVLKLKISEYFKNNLCDRGELIIDTVQEPGGEYPYNHDITFLTKDLHCQVLKIGSDIRQREIFSIQKIN